MSDLSTNGGVSGTWGDQPHYGMGFGPEGDGVELMGHIASMRIATTAFPEIQYYGFDFGAYSADLTGDPIKMLQARGLRAPSHLKYELDVSAAELGELLIRAWPQPAQPGSFENIQWSHFTFETKESTAKPSLPALTRQAGEKYKGLGFCSE